jgi:tetratricopeptide (TPR) repeat protein
MDLLLEDLQQQIIRREVIAIVGAGVSIGTTRDPIASWTGLLRNGISRCEIIGAPRPYSGWGDQQRAALDIGQLDELLLIASLIEGRLGGRNGGEYRRWLRETVGTLRATDRAVLEALNELGVPLATTNYDGLIEEVTGLPSVTWRDGARVQRMIRGDEPGILHLHGYWQQPDSVVLGIRSYDQVLGDAHAQTVQSALALMKGFLFVGCGAGLADPNFSALRRLMRNVLASAEYRHFRLCRDDEREAIQNQHPPEERIFAVGYGATHADLAPFLRRLKPNTASPPARPKADASASLPPRPARVFGRDELVRDLVTALLLDTPPPVAVLGGPGFGKSTLCLTALHEPRVAERFGARRWFIRCESANTAEDVLKEIALALGVPVGPSLSPRVFAALAEAPGGLVLDNAETPWEAAPLQTEELFSQLSGIPGLALTVAIRGQQRPLGPAWRQPALSVAPLGSVDSRNVFLAIAGERHAADRYLPDLLGALDGIPLAIELLAYAAEAEPNLDALWRRWQAERVTLLSRADGKTRLVNAAVSFELSITGRRMTDEARHLLSMLAVLPDGIAYGDLPAVIQYPDRAAATLRQVGLAFDEGGRLRALAPIREHVALDHPPKPEVLALALEHYIDLVRNLGDKVGQPGGDVAVRRLAADARNIEEMLSTGLKAADPAPVIGGAIKYSAFLSFSGLGTPHLLETARQRARQFAGSGDNALLEVNCVKGLGDIALARSDHETARERFEEAQSLYKEVGNVLGVANCIKGLGDVALAGSDHKAAQARFQEARPLYKQVSNIPGEANCIKGLGDIALVRSDQNTACARFKEAQSLYQKVGGVLGEANCIKGLGDIALGRSDHDTARTRFEEARSLYRQVGEVRGEANCVKGLGDIALARCDHGPARAHFEEAQSLYQRVGNVLGIANCIKGLGDIALARSDHETARACFEEALGLYERIPDQYSVGNAHRSLGRLAGTKPDQARHMEAAREAWRSVQRHDLIQGLDAELAG